MSLPRLVTPDDVDKIVTYLRHKPTGSPIADAASALGKPALDAVRLEAYVDWGFVKNDADILSVTELGRSLTRSDAEKKHEIYTQILRRYDLYVKTLEYFYYQKIEEILTTDLASYWVNNYAEIVASKNARSLNAQVVCFGRILGAAGMGNFILGRGKNSSNSRLEVSRESLHTFVTGSEVPIELPTDSGPENSIGVQEDTSSAVVDVDRPQYSKPALPPDPIQSLQINVQVQITADVTPDQIDQIFKSMATHLYGKDDS